MDSSPNYINSYKYIYNKNNTNKDIISWNRDGTAIVIHDQENLTKVVLPAYLQINKFKSFIRQLNYYGFKRAKKGESDFINKYFVRDNEYVPDKEICFKILKGRPRTENLLLIQLLIWSRSRMSILRV